MRSQIKILKSDLDKFLKFLQAVHGIEINSEIVGKRVFMWRVPPSQHWTQVYDGKTCSGKNERDFLRVWGSDAALVEQFYAGKKS